ncbi:MAG: GntR family transcriptional regulator [Lachnospiraceae bacterium]|nr:GntR family transcriptional regulator [Lachnospiraceae bacterium]
MVLHKPVSLADQIFDRLETDILTEKYPKGTILTEVGLSEELGVSRTPVREALSRLEQEHIIENAGKGVRVIGISEEDIHVVYEIREKIEGMAAAACAKNCTDEDIAELREIVELQEFYADKKDAEQVKAYDNRFHEKIYHFSRSPILYDVLIPLHRKVQKVRKISIQNTGRAHASAEEHRRIMEAIAAHDPVAAEKAMIVHVLFSRNHILSILKV